MADKKISELTAITGANTAATDVFVVVDTSTGQTKKITREELNNAIEQDVLSSIDIDTINGDFSVNGNINLGDNNKAIFGAGSDLEIYHDGSNSYVKDAGTGNLNIQGNHLSLEDSTGTRFFLGLQGGETRIYNQGNEKLAATATGIDVTGTVTAGAGTHILGDGTAASQLIIKASSTTNATIDFGDADDTNIGRIQYNNTDNSMLFRTNNSERLRIDSSGNVGIGTSSPAKDLHIVGGDFSGLRIVHETDGTTFNLQSDSSGNTQLNATTATDITFLTTNFERMRIDSSGRVGIGTSSPTSDLTFGAATPTISTDTSDGSDTSRLSIGGGGNATSTGRGSLVQYHGNEHASAAGSMKHFMGNASGSYISWHLGSGSEAMRIDSSGNVGIGTSSPSSYAKLTLQGNGTETIPTDSLVQSNDSSTLQTIWNSDNAAKYSGIKLETRTSGASGWLIANEWKSTYLGDLVFRGRSGASSSSERMRIDSSGNVLVGTTTSIPAGASQNVTGIAMQSDGQLQVSADGQFAGAFNRKTSDGDILEFRKDGTTVGSIGTASGYSYWAAPANFSLMLVTNDIRPRSVTGSSNNDNYVDIGTSSARFDDIYATNGTIQTSDQNEKQQIASLTDAEITAAKAISTLFKTFKWSDKVEAKGDAARTHTGVIAQDVQQAMTDAGLDAGDYAFFISATWWETQTEVPAVEADEENGVEAADAYTRTDTYETAEEAPEGATERTRLGIRYPELLAFVGAATEQRLANIETRLTALEN